MYKKIVWPSIVSISIGLMLAFVIGFVIAVNISSSESEERLVKSEGIDKENEVMTFNTEDFNLLVLGDSIGAGIGDQNNLGLGNRYADLAKDEGDPQIIVQNLAVPGAITSDLLGLVEAGSSKALIESADLIIISIGGNDINRLLRQGAMDVIGEYDLTLRGYSEALTSIIKQIRGMNAEVSLVLIGLYNPYGSEVEGDQIRLLLDWNYQTQQLIALEEAVYYVPVYNQFANHLDTYLFVDQFHPSAEGYAYIAGEIYEMIGDGQE